jgi:hypothetical protein
VWIRGAQGFGLESTTKEKLSVLPEQLVVFGSQVEHGSRQGNMPSDLVLLVQEADPAGKLFDRLQSVGRNELDAIVAGPETGHKAT